MAPGIKDYRDRVELSRILLSKSGSMGRTSGIGIIKGMIGYASMQSEQY